MATSQFYSVCLAHESIKACRALLLTSPCHFPRRFLHLKAMSVSQFTFQQSTSDYGCGGPSSFTCRAFSSVGPSSRSKKPTPTSQNPREEIRKLDEEIRRLEKERRSVGKPIKQMLDAGEKSLHGEKKGNAGWGSDASSKAKYGKSSPIGGNAKFAASTGSSRGANARALARYEQEDTEEEDDVDFEEEDAIDSDKDSDVSVADDDELGEDFSSDAEMCMESSDDDQLCKDETSSVASCTSKKPDADPTEVLESSQVEKEDLVNETPSVNDVKSEGGHSIKHPWKEWNDFYDVLCQKNYFKDVLPNIPVMEGEGYLRFQASAHMKRAVLDFSRERDDIIR
ncbi:hypothetical protein L7F22_014516 [Adiantum nelumboides]|nr:hypothetical protein [Adiantum nelumboides]